MKLNDLIKHSIIDHELDKEKIKKEIEARRRKTKIYKNAVIFAVIAAFVLIPVTMAILKIGDHNMPGIVSDTAPRITKSAELSVPQDALTMPQAETTSAVKKKKLAVAERIDNKPETDYGDQIEINQNLLNAFDSFDGETEFLIKLLYSEYKKNPALVDEWKTYNITSYKIQNLIFQYAFPDKELKNGDEEIKKEIYDLAEQGKECEAIIRDTFLSAITASLEKNGIEIVSVYKGENDPSVIIKLPFDDLVYDGYLAYTIYILATKDQILNFIPDEYMRYYFESCSFDYLETGVNEKDFEDYDIIYYDYKIK